MGHPYKKNIAWSNLKTNRSFLALSNDITSKRVCADFHERSDTWCVCTSVTDSLVRYG